MTEWAPAAMALVTSPENLMPPSAMIRRSDLVGRAGSSMMAVTWGTPTAGHDAGGADGAGPMPTFTPSAPASMRSRAPSGAPTLPAIS